MFTPFQHHDDIIDYSMKIVLVGDSGTGKTTIVQQYCKRQQVANTQPTIGVDFTALYLQTIKENPNVKVKCTIFDTAGQERFRSMATTFFKDADAILLVYDLTRKESFDNIPSWLSQIHIHAKNSNLTLSLIGNKLDLAQEQRQVSTEELNSFVKDFQADACQEVGNVLFGEVSAMANLNLEHTMETLIWEVLQRKRNPKYLQDQKQKFATVSTTTTTESITPSSTTKLPPSNPQPHVKSRNNNENCAGFQSKSTNIE